MIGVMFCRDQLGQSVVLLGFSGDSGGADDVEGWSNHIPPNGPNSFMTTGN